METLRFNNMIKIIINSLVDSRILDCDSNFQIGQYNWGMLIEGVEFVQL